MSERTSYAPGTPSWVDLGTPDVEASTAFYSALFGWDILPGPPEAGGYQLGLWTGTEMFWFPSLRKGQKYRHTLQGRRTPHSFFALVPFEPPGVPIPAEYEVRFVQKVPPYPELPSVIKTWRKKVPYGVPCGPLPFNLRGVPRDQR